MRLDRLTKERLAEIKSLQHTTDQALVLDELVDEIEHLWAERDLLFDDGVEKGKRIVELKKERAEWVKQRERITENINALPVKHANGDGVWGGTLGFSGDCLLCEIRKVLEGE